MSKVVSFIVLAGLMLAAIEVVSVYDRGARQETKFVPISVLAKNQADYGVGKDAVVIPAVSTDILEDKVHDLQQDSSIPIIHYTSLPAESEAAADQDNAQSNDENEPHNDLGNHGYGNPNSNNGNGNGGPSTNNGQGNENKPNKPEKPDKPGKDPKPEKVK